MAARRRWWRAIRWRRWLAVLGAMILVLFVWQQVAGRRTEAQQREAVAFGQPTFRFYCAPCHGFHMQGRPFIGKVGAPPLNKRGYRIFFRLMPDAMEGWVADQIAEGNAIMPAFRGTLNARQRREVALYIRLVNMGGAPVP